MKQSVYKNFLAKIEQGKQISEFLKRKKDLRSYSTYCKELAVQCRYLTSAKDELEVLID